MEAVLLSHKQCVVTNLHAGLGNNLFQYTAGLSVVQHLDARLSFRHDRPTPSSARLVELLGVDLELATPPLLRRFGFAPPTASPIRAAQRVRRRIDRSLGRIQVVRPKGAFEPWNANQIRPDAEATLLRGYFQHPSWFEPSLIVTADRLAQRFSRITDPALGTDATVISFRRGDYVRFGWDLTLDYYATAIDRIGRVDGPIWVLGDDQVFVELVKLWLLDKGMVAAKLPDLGVDEVTRDLALLAFADRVIMSNSTFCWWGVVAGNPDGRRDDRTVIAPAQWLPQGGNALIRPEWQTIE